MKILKPDNLALVYRGLRLARRDVLSIGMIAGFRFDDAGLDGLMPETDVWAAVAGALGKNAILDEGYPKPVGEYLIHGAAHAPAGTQVVQQRVSARIGTLGKSLVVSGERRFNALGLISAATPYTQMPIEPATAFGGTGCADNPAGKGYAEIDNADGTRVWPLPNVEGETRRIASRGDRAAPAGFWGFGSDAPFRRQHLGACDERWLKSEWPHLPSDTRPEFFLSAPSDQRLPGYFTGDERFEIVNMHPRASVLKGVLPRLRSRCFVNANDTLTEVAAHAETLWLFPELECGVVLYRALANIADTDASQVTHVMAEWERQGDAPLPFEHYRDVFRERIAVAVPARAAAAVEPAEAAEPLAMPVAAAAPQAAVVSFDASALSAVQTQTAALNNESRALMAKFGKTDADIAPYLKDAAPERVPTLAEVKASVAELNAETRALMQKYGVKDADAARYLNQPEADASAADLPGMLARLQAETQQRLRDAGLSEADVRRQLASRPELAETLPHLAPPGVVSAADFAALAALAAKPPAPAIEMPAIDMPEAEAPAVVQLTREDVIARHAARASLANYDLSGVDLSKLDLSGADFSGAVLDKTSFAGSRLADADFTRALLHGADLSETDLQRARFTQSSAAASTFAKADLRGAQLADADFTGADCSASKLNQADLRGAIFDQSKLAGADLSACRAHHASFTDADLSGAKFIGADLVAASFSGSGLAGCDFSAAACRQAEFYGAHAQQAVFTDADLSQSRADAKTCFDDARFTRTRLVRAAWDGVQVRRASFERAVIDHADLGNAQAQAARFGASSAKGARFDKADLSGADLDAVNLFGGSLRKSNLKGTLLRHANLYGVDFDGAQPTLASLEGSNIDCTILQFRPPVI
ncbi:DUF2169 domain-containing protein [Caballeronia novacaledonica]|uniref:DUF2169 family type VI secretion system accessory protein n=1 Tax=Caballeronia novacaledonica TaxID=1544861 RepID=UPI001EE2F784|nr:DUF2169 domain-containing protein [Caballeronia novacaledonica]GJH09608.1 DUF2169 domain-containing protein [Caballeronia novacaledonica]